MGRLAEVAPGVEVATSRFMVTNTVVLVTETRALVIDPGVHADELDALADELHERDLDVVGGFATHAHWDHVLWSPRLGDVPRWASATTVDAAAANHDDLVADATAVTAVDARRLGALRAAGDALPWDGPTAELVGHDAHQAGHAALFVPDLDVLVAGDMGSDIEVPLLEHGIAGPDALANYRLGLERLAAVPRTSIVITGHGHVCSGREWRRRLDADRRYLDRLAGGRDADDPRLAERWLADAHEAMQARLDKPSWRRWAARLAPVTPARAHAVCAGLAEFLGIDPGVVAAYMATPGEVDIGGVLATLAEPALPRLDGDTVTWHRQPPTLELHRFGFRQPPAGAPEIDPAGFDVVLVPGRVFDRHGIRLGRGGGHYDRLVPGLRPGIPILGVTCEERVVDRLPSDDHDAPMTHLATETGVHAIG